MRVRPRKRKGRIAWNLLKLEGDYYFMDTTWGDFSNTDPSKNGGSRIGYDYFCVDTRQLLKDHTPDADFPLPECTASKCNYYARSGLLFDTYSYDSLLKVMTGYVNRGLYIVSVKYTSQAAFEEAENAAKDGKDIYRMLAAVNAGTAKVAANRYSHSVSREQLSVTLYLEQAKKSGGIFRRSGGR